MSANVQHDSKQKFKASCIRYGDPDEYGAICTTCYARFGAPLPRWEIDLRPCPDCVRVVPVKKKREVKI
jgi:hypothetical protein